MNRSKPTNINWGGRVTLAAICLAWVVLGAASGRTATIVSNLSQNNDAGEAFSDLQSQKLGAQAFQTGSVTNTLDAITVRLANFAGSGGSTVEISLRADNEGLPGAVIETLGNIQFVSPTSTDYTINSTTHPTLLPNTKYWVVLGYVAGDLDWLLTAGSSSTGTGTLLPDDRFSVDGGASWGSNSPEDYLMAVEGTELIPSITVDIPQGFSLLANPLLASDNSMAGILGDAPPGTQVFIFVPATSSFNVFEQVDLGGGTIVWFPNGNTELRPGAGALVSFLAAQSKTFTGRVPTGADAEVSIGGGFSLISSPLPRGGGLQSVLEFPAAVGDQVFQFDVAAGKFKTFEYVQRGSQTLWYPREPTIAVGEAFFVKKVAPVLWSPGSSN